MKKIKNIIQNIFTWFKKLSLLKRAVLLVVIIAIVYFLRPKTEQQVVNYQTAPVKIGSVTELVSETGEIMSTGKTDVLSTINGIVQEIYVENGQVIQRGQALFKVVSSATEEERATTYAAYLSAKATLETAKSNQYAYQADMFEDWDFFKELAESDNYEDSNSVNRTLPEFHIPEKDWLASEGKYKTQEQVVTQAQASVNQKWLAHQATINGNVKAPIDGTVVNLAVAPGQEVNTTNTALMLVSEGETWVILSVSEADIIKLSSGQEAEVSVDALNGNTFKAMVKRVDEVGVESSGVVTYNVYLLLDNPPFNIRPTMTVQVDITTENKEGVLVVPNSAIKPYQGAKAVQTLNSTGQAMYLPIKIGIAGQAHTEIISGLKEGQEIIVGQTSNGNKGSKNNGGVFPIPAGH